MNELDRWLNDTLWPLSGKRSSTSTKPGTFAKEDVAVIAAKDTIGNSSDGISRQPLIPSTYEYHSATLKDKWRSAVRWNLPEMEATQRALREEMKALAPDFEKAARYQRLLEDAVQSPNARLNQSTGDET